LRENKSVADKTFSLAFHHQPTTQSADDDAAAAARFPFLLICIQTMDGTEFQSCKVLTRWPHLRLIARSVYAEKQSPFILTIPDGSAKMKFIKIILNVSFEFHDIEIACNEKRLLLCDAENAVTCKEEASKQERVLVLRPLDDDDDARQSSVGRAREAEQWRRKRDVIKIDGFGSIILR